MAEPNRSRPAPSNEPRPADDTRFLPLEIRAPTEDAKCLESRLESLDAEVTPTRQFFVRSHFPVPRIDAATWRVVIDGDVERPLSLTLEDLRDLPHRTVQSVLECAGNSRMTVRPKPEGVLWGHGAVSAARWSGVALRDVLKLAGPKPTAIEVLFEGADHGAEPGVAREIPYQMSVSLPKALEDDTLLADGMNGTPLPPSHGFPVRAIVPGWYGMASVKWLTRITVTSERFAGYFRTRAYAYIREGDAPDTPTDPATTIRVKSLITWPREGQVLAPGPHRIRGVAWSGNGRVVRVEVSADPPTAKGGYWQDARVAPAPSPRSWVHWELLCDLPTSGFHVLRVRATDEIGNVQPAEAEWNFRGLGNNSVHSVPIEVRPGGPPDSA